MAALLAAIIFLVLPSQNLHCHRSYVEILKWTTRRWCYAYNTGFL